MINDYVAFDLETTGFNPVVNKIIEIGAVKVKDGQIIDKFSELINPEIIIPEVITQVTGIDNDMVQGKRRVEDVVRDFVDFCDCDVILGHNLPFDYSFISANVYNLGISFKKAGIDTLKIARKHLSSLESRKLDFLCAYYGIEDKEHHRAYNDAYVTVMLYKKLSECFENENDSVFVPEPMTQDEKKINRKLSPITLKQKAYLTSLISRHNIVPEKNIDELTKSEASRMIDHILSTYGRRDFF